MADLFLSDRDGFERMLEASFGGMDVGSPDVFAHFDRARGASTTGIELHSAFDFTCP